MAKEVAEVQKLLQASGLTCTMHSAGTTVEGSWEDVFRVIGQAHSLVHQLGVVRIQTSMRVGTRYGFFSLFYLFIYFYVADHYDLTRTDKKQSAADKVKRVEDLLNA